MANDVDVPSVDRLLCGRWRLMAQASVRHEDLKRSPVGVCQFVIAKDGSNRAVWAASKITKTFPRTWICSTLNLDPEGEGWVSSLIDLLREAHGKEFSQDDHFGKRALPDRSSFDVGPPEGQADTCHMRSLMMLHNKKLKGEDKEALLSSEDIADIRHHGAKCTLTSCSQYLDHNGCKEVSRTAVRNQGGWKA